ncbi:MAG TPA: antibiotic biosynthesis monooxygenase [Aestuariivirga sp.]|nr:antibiotic biosynthesis monooxygenase [Aestuariivirga sp.]
MKNALEIVTFKIKDGAKVPDFLRASAEMEEGFAKKQEGFLSRTFARGEGNDWVDVIRWRTMADAEAASKAAMQSPACAPMFGMIDEPSVKMMHFEILS